MEGTNPHIISKIPVKYISLGRKVNGKIKTDNQIMQPVRMRYLYFIQMTDFFLNLLVIQLCCCFFFLQITPLNKESLYEN